MPTHLIDPSICFLNHGSFGSTPLELLELQHALRLEMEREPVDFLKRHHPERWHRAVASVSTFLNSDPAGTVFTHNATSGVNAVIGSFPWAEGDQILTTNHRYDAVRNTFDYAAKRRGLEVVEANIPFPIQRTSQIIDAIEAAITPRTRMIAIDQIASPTAIIFPVDAIIELARQRGIATLVDGAHAPGQLNLNLAKMAPDFWVGNLHKWLCAPKGAAVLVVAEPWRDTIHPTTISHGYNQGLQEEFGWTGTSDTTAWFCAEKAIEMHEAQGGVEFRRRNHTLVQEGRKVIAQALDMDLPHPDDPLWYGSMAAIPLPCSSDTVPNLFQRLRDAHLIEVQVVPWDNRAWVRISGYAAYNTPDQYHRLASALVSELR